MSRNIIDLLMFNNTAMKKCRRCGIEKDNSEFTKCSANKDGLFSYCKECKNRDHKEYHKEWYAKNKDKKNAQSRAYNKANPDILKKAHDKYLSKPGVREKRNAKTAEWAKNNPEKRIAKEMRRRANLANAYQDGSITPKAIADMLVAQDGKCNICKCDITEGFDRDHIIPISKGGDHTIVNIQLLCGSCNRKKWNKILTDNKL